MRAIVLAAMFAAVSLPAFAHHGLVHEGCDPAATFTAGDITVSGAFTRAMAPGAPAAGGYLTIANGGSSDDTLVSAASEAAGMVQLHEMKMEGDVMKMNEVPGGIVVPAGGSVSLAPGGLHVMFMDVGTPFKEGECVEVLLHFEKAGDLPVTLPIGGPAADAPPEHMKHGG
jgi:copper(I)-binding protein